MPGRRLTHLSIVGNVVFIAAVVALVLVLTSRDNAEPTAAQHGGPGQPQGAEVLGANPAQYVAPKEADGFVPDPVSATDDVPDAYEQGCQVAPHDTEPIVCDYGDPRGEIDVVLVGDSKALQWISAIDTLGKRHGWHVQTMTKSTCPFTAAPRMVGGERFTACDDWNDAVRDQLVQEPPDVVITPQRTREAMNKPSNPDEGGSVNAMARGLHERWEELINAGSDVVVLRDNPTPPGDPDSGVYECVAENADDLSRCSFSRDNGEQTSAGDAQLRATDQTPDAQVVDLNDYICPTDTCPPVIGDVLVYRQSSHLTRTYVDSLTSQLDKELVRLVSELRSGRTPQS